MGFLAVDLVRNPQKYRTTSNNRLSDLPRFLVSYHLENIAAIARDLWYIYIYIWYTERSVLRAYRSPCRKSRSTPSTTQLDSIHFPNLSPSAPTKKSSITFFHPIITSCFPTEDSLPKRFLSHGELVRRKCCWGKWWTCVVFPQVHGKVANIKSQHRLTKHWELHQETWKNKNYLGPLPPTKNAPRKIVFQFHQVLVRFVPDIHSSKLFLGSPPVSLGGNVGSCSRRKSSSNFTWHLRRSFVFRNHDNPMESQRVCWDYTPWN